MTIADEIARIKTNISNAYTSCQNKGATLPETQNSANLATTIDSITSIGIPREVSKDGVYQMPSSDFTFSLPDGSTDLGERALFGAFYRCTKLTTVDLSSLTTISGVRAVLNAFYECTKLTNVDLSSLTTISGEYAFGNVFNNCTELTSIDLSSLTTISGSQAMSYTFYYCEKLTTVDLSSLTTVSGSQAMSNTFYRCTGLTSIDLSSLTTVSGSQAMNNTFSYCTKLKELSFPALTSNAFGNNSNQFNKMLTGVTGCTVHFPANLESVIGSWSDVISGFGGTNTTVLFDLPATE